MLNVRFHVRLYYNDLDCLINLLYKTLKDALLAYADCLYFGLKQMPNDEDQASVIYKDASDLKQPEALHFVAINNYVCILRDLGLDSQFNIFVDLPWEKIETFNKLKVKDLFGVIETLAHMNWVSPLFVYIARQIVKNGIIPRLRYGDVVEFVLRKREMGETINLEFIPKPSLIKPCSYRKCNFKLSLPNDAIKASLPMSLKMINVLCKRCLKKKYCSSQCKYFDDIF